jgi:hypothetical protein
MFKRKLMPLILFIGATIFACHAFANTEKENLSDQGMSTFTRLYLSINSTKEHPQYFQCDIAPDPDSPTGIKVPLQFTQVHMVNYAQMISNFNGLGIIDTTADYVNSYTFSAYHDPSPFAKNKKGFVDIFVAWPAYSVKCKAVASPTKDRPLVPHFG